MYVLCINKSVLFRSSKCTVTVTLINKSPGRTDITLATKYLRRSRRVNTLHFILTSVELWAAGNLEEIRIAGIITNCEPTIQIVTRFKKLI